MSASFKVGDRVGPHDGSRFGTVIGFWGGGAVVVDYGPGTACGWPPESLRLAPAPPVNQRPIQLGDYIKDPGPRPVDALLPGDVVYGTGSFRVRCIDGFEGDCVRMTDGAVWLAREARRLPPDAILDVERSPKRDVMQDPEYKAALERISGDTGDGARHVDGSRCPSPLDAKKVAAMPDRLAEQAALLTRALSLVSGLNLQHHSVTRAQFETAQALCRDLVRVLKPGRG